MLCGGRLTPSVEPDKATSATRVIAFVAVSCQACAGPAPRTKLAMVICAGAVTDAALLIAMIVRAPSRDRTAANAATLSGSGAAAVTLVSPKLEPLPS